MKINDHVKMSYKNTNHLGNDVCAYTNMEGKVTEIWKDGSFCIFTGSSNLIVPMCNRRYVYVFLNGVHTKIKRKSW